MRLHAPHIYIEDKQHPATFEPSRIDCQLKHTARCIHPTVTMAKRKFGSSQVAAFLESLDQLFNEQHSSGHRTPGDFKSLRSQIIGLLDDCNGMSVSKAFASHDFRLGNGKAPATKPARPPSWVQLSRQEKFKLTKTGKASSFVKALRNMLIRQEKAHQNRLDATFESGGESDEPTPKRRKRKQLDGEGEYQPSPENKSKMQSNSSFFNSPNIQKRTSAQKDDKQTGSASSEQKGDSTTRRRIKLSVNTGSNKDEDKKMRKPGTLQKAKPTVFEQIKGGSQGNPDMDFSSLPSPFEPFPGRYLWGEPRQSHPTSSQRIDQSGLKLQSFDADTKDQHENTALERVETSILDTSRNKLPRRSNGGVARATPMNASSEVFRNQSNAGLPQNTAALCSPAHRDKAGDTNVSSNHEDASASSEQRLAPQKLATLEGCDVPHHLPYEYPLTPFAKFTYEPTEELRLQNRAEKDGCEDEEPLDFGQRYSSLDSDNSDTETDSDSPSDSPMADESPQVPSFQSTVCERKIWPSVRQHTLPLRQIVNIPLQRLRTSLQIHKCHYEHIEPKLWKRYVKKLESFVQEPKFRQRSLEQRLGRFRKIVHCDEELAAMPTEDWERTRRAARLCGWLVEVTTARGEDAKAWAERKTLACIRDIDCLERTIGTKHKEREGQKNDGVTGDAMDGVGASQDPTTTGTHQVASNEHAETDAMKGVET